MQGRLIDLITLEGGEQRLTLSIKGDYRAEFDKLKNLEIDFTAKPHMQLRSLNANAYCWLIMTKIGKTMKPPLSKEEVYRLMLKRYGQGGVISVQTDVLPDVIREFDYYDVRGTSELNGKEFTHIEVYVGSSKYNRSEMAHFIDGIVYEAKELGIDTATPEQIANFEYMARIIETQTKSKGD